LVDFEKNKQRNEKNSQFGQEDIAWVTSFCHDCKIQNLMKGFTILVQGKW
jgi:hypothetical protein